MTGSDGAPAADVLPSRRRARTQRSWVARVVPIVAVAVLVAVFADLVVTAAAGHLHQPQYWPTFESQRKYDALRAEAPAATTVFIGDSVLDSALDPGLLPVSGLGSSFNASLAGEPFQVLSDWTRIVTRAVHPKTIVLGFDINVLNDGNAAGEALLADAFQRSRPVAVAEGRGDLLDHLDVWLHEHVALFKYRSALRQPFQNSNAAGAQIYDPPLTALGWNSDFAAKELGNTPADLSAAVTKIDHDILLDYHFDDDRLRDFASLVAQERRTGVNVVFVSMPVSPAFVQAVPGGRADFDAAVTALKRAAGASGARVVPSGLWPSRYFADAAHFNRAGTIRFSAWIASELGARP